MKPPGKLIPLIACLPEMYDRPHCVMDYHQRLSGNILEVSRERIRVFPDIGLLESGDAAFEDEECLIVAKGRGLRMQEHGHVRLKAARR